MNIRNLVRESNPIAYTVIRNAKKNNLLSHAYLISADKKIDTTNVSTLLMQSIVCEEKDVLACNECSSCKRVAINNYADLRIIDGKNNLIKKQQIADAISALTQTPLEISGKKILWIKNIENTNKHSINSLLKFIEEPRPNTYIIITTNSIGNVLTTIRSRAQLIQLKPKKIELIAKDLISKRVNAKYAILLATIFPSAQLALESYEQDFIEVHSQIKEFVSNIIISPKKASISFISYFKKKSNYILYLEILDQFFNDIWRIKIGKQVLCQKFKSTIQLLSENEFDFLNAIEEIWNFKEALKYNANFDLAKEKMIIGILG
ncbi:MAG: hypothetical protein GY679_03150 [Mycoplasma sp.]|nr:hypothetical protein [Mycoplasma sp.]